MRNDPQIGNVTVEFAPAAQDEQYTEYKKRSILKIIFEGFEKREKSTVDLVHMYNVE